MPLPLSILYEESQPQTHDVVHEFTFVASLAFIEYDSVCGRMPLLFRHLCVQITVGACPDLGSKDICSRSFGSHDFRRARVLRTLA